MPAAPNLQLPAAPHMGPAELAAELAELYALSLVRDLPFALMQDPHCTIWIDGTTRFTLHELLCELRSLSWFDDQALPVPGPIETVLCSRTVCGEADHRRGLRLNGDGQLTLRTLFRGVVARRGPEMRLSAFHRADPDARTDLEFSEAPDATAPMSRWLDWIERCSGASLTLPDEPEMAPPGVDTPRALVERIHQSHPCRTYFNAVLRLLARGAEFDPGLRPLAGEAPLAPQGILSMMAEAADLAFSSAMRMQGRADRLSRPGVFAARITSLLRTDEMPAQENGTLRAAAEELSHKAPNLLHWIDRYNRVHGRDGLDGQTLLLPAMRGAVPQHRADYVAQAMIAGALSTLLKALFDSRRHARLRMVGADKCGVDICSEADRLAADVALARSVAGGYFQAENHQDLRLGEALACQVLRSRLEAQGRSLSLGFTDFDGRAVTLSVHPRGLHGGHATFQRDGRLAPWPMERMRSGAHLAVV
jgi:hypothetical protein